MGSQRREYPHEYKDLGREAGGERGPSDAGTRRLDQARTLEPDWFQRPQMLGYAAYADRFTDDLAGVRAKIPYARAGVTYLHLMRLLRPREGDNDGGYAVADYRQVRPDLGTMQDLRELSVALRREGISLVMDLVLKPRRARARVGAGCQGRRPSLPRLLLCVRGP